MFDIKLKILVCSARQDLRRMLHSVAPDQGLPFTFLPPSKSLTPELAAQADIIICDIPLAEVPRQLSHREGDGVPHLIFAEYRTNEVEDAGRLSEFEDIWIMPASPQRLAYRLHRVVRYATYKRERVISKGIFQSAMDSLPDLFWMKDLTGRHHNVNKAFCTLVRKTKEQCEGRGHYYIWDIEPEEYEKGEFVCLESENEVVQAGKTCVFDEKIIGPDGNKLQFQTYKTPIFDIDGAVIGTMGIARDVTNWKNQSVELGIIVNSLMNAAMIVDANDKIVVANRALEELCGQDKDAVIGQNYTQWRTDTLHYPHSISPGEHVQIEYHGGDAIRNLEIVEEPIFDIFNQYVGRFVRLVDVTEHMEHIGLLLNYKKQLETDVQAKTKTIQEMQHKFLISFSDLLNSRDASAGSHIKNTTFLVEVILAELQKQDKLALVQDEEYCECVKRAVPLHDIGKIAVPDAVLNSKKNLSGEETAMIRAHTKRGGRILAKTLAHLESFKYFKIAWNMAVYHHENWDGSGYPSGLKGDKIPFEARIMAAANYFDHLMSGCASYPGYSLDEAFEMVRRATGSRLDPIVAEALQAARPAIEKVAVQHWK